MLKLVTANTTELDPESNAAMVDCYDGGDAEEEREPYGKLPMMCSLSSIAIPFPPTPEGKAELVVAEGIGGANGRAVGGWDTRLASMAGELGPGDACDFAPHPNKAVRVLYKGDGRAWAVVIDAEDGSQAIVSLAVKEGFNVNVNGHSIKASKDGLSMCSANGKNGIDIDDSSVALRGNVTAGPPGIPGLTLGVAPAAAWGAVGVTPVFGLKVGG